MPADDDGIVHSAHYICPLGLGEKYEACAYESSLIVDGRSAVVLHEHMGIKVDKKGHKIVDTVGDHETAMYDKLSHPKGLKKAIDKMSIAHCGANKFTNTISKEDGIAIGD